MIAEAKRLIQRYTGHEVVQITCNGNAAIFAALCFAKKQGVKTVVIPDQGGWLTYKKYPGMLGLRVQEIETNAGLIEPRHLRLDGAAAILYENPAGYFADQPITETYEACKGKCMVIMDVTGCIGDAELCDGRYADIMVGSFGRWKPINLGYGGFISFRQDSAEARLFLRDKEICKDKSECEARIGGLPEKLRAAASRLELFYGKCDRIKRELAMHDIIHRERKGINVVIRLHDEDEKKELINYCERNKYEYTLCPRYIRVLEPAISIEVKRL